jgi:hypothetical protein
MLRRNSHSNFDKLIGVFDGLRFPLLLLGLGLVLLSLEASSVWRSFSAEASSEAEMGNYFSMQASAQGNLSGRQFFIALSGDDNNPGTRERPWRTFLNINTPQVGPGDVVYVRGGVYSEVHLRGTDPDSAAVLRLTGYNGVVKGDLSAPIVIRPYPGERPVLDPQFRGVGVVFEGDVRNVVLEGFTIRNGRGYGVWLVDNPSYITIRSNRVRDADGQKGNNIGGIVINGANHILIERNAVHGNYLHSESNGNGANIFIFSGTNNITIRNNELYDSEHGVWYKHSGNGPATIENNYIHDCRLTGIYSASDNVTMRNNLLVRVTDAFNIHEEAGCRDCTRNNVIEHNTVAYSRFYRLNERVDRAGAVGTIVRDNIFYSPGVDYGRFYTGVFIWAYGFDDDLLANTPKLQANNNLFYTSNFLVNYFGATHPGRMLGGIYTLAQFQSLGFEQRSIFADPLFVDPSRGDYKLQPNSPARLAASDRTHLGARICAVGVSPNCPVCD